MFERKVPILSAFLTLCLILSGCATGSGASYLLALEKGGWGTPAGSEGTATVGNLVMFSREGGLPSHLRMTGSIDSSMPGAAGLPFRFSVAASTLEYVDSVGDWHLYAAPSHKVTASHALLGSVISQGDIIGVALVGETGAMEWIVDNSIHNRAKPRTWIWHRRVTREDRVSFTASYEKMAGPSQAIKTINYDGLVDGKLRFTFEDATKIGSSSKEYFFELNKDGPTMVSIKGAQFLVTAVDGISIRYKVLQQFDR